MQQDLPTRHPIRLLKPLPSMKGPKGPTEFFLRVRRRLINSTTTTQWPNLACSHAGLLVSSVLLVFDKFPINTTDIISALEVKRVGK